MSPQTLPRRPRTQQGQYAGLRGGLYARKSQYRGKKNSKHRSVAEQLAAGREDADRLGVVIGSAGEYVDDGISASRHAAEHVRDDFERLLDDIEHRRLDIVIAWASTRLQRDLSVYVRLRDACTKAGVLWCYGGRIYDLSDKDDRFRTGLDALVGEREVDELRDNVMRSLRANASDGRPHGRAPYGYQRVYDEKTGAYVRTDLNPEQAEVVREICEGVASGKAYKAIADSLNARGVTPPTEFWSSKQVERMIWIPIGKHPQHSAIKAEVVRRLDAGETSKGIAKDFNERDLPKLAAQWYPATITAYASDPRYLGARTHNGVVTAENAWPRIVDASTHAQCLAVIKKRKKGKTYNTRPGKAKYWLPGIATCHVCNAPVFFGMNGAKATATAKGTVKPRLNCTAAGVPGLYGGKGYHVSFDMKLADDFVREQLFDWLASPGFIAAYVASDKDRAQRVGDAEGELAILRVRLEEFEEQAVNGALSATSFAKIESGLRVKIAEAEKQLGQLRVPAVVADLAGATRDEIADAWELLDLSQQRLIAETLLEVRIKPTGRGTRPESAEPYVAVTPKRLTLAS